MSSLERLFQLLPQGHLGNRYRLDRCLGDGTYGYVWKVERLPDHQIVAIKIPKAQGGRNRDLEEGRALIQTPRHPNVISIFWMGRVPPEREIFTIEMEYFNSSTLAFILDARDARFVASYQYVFELYEQVLEGVCHLHQVGISHGDIKPQNILVQGHQLKLTDFGSSIYTQDIYARCRENGGTVLYSPPEDAGLTTRQKDWALAVAHDVYSLGVLLYQLLTGQLPHDTLAQVVRHTPFPRPSELNSSICPALEEVVLRCLELQPGERWTSAEALKKAFVRARDKQLQLDAKRPPLEPSRSVPDWSSHVLAMMKQEEWRQAEIAAAVEFKQSGDGHAFLLMVRAAYHDERYFDVLRALEANPQILETETPVTGDLEQLALEVYLHTERFYDAMQMVNRCLARQGDRPGLMLRKASVLGLMARYKEASEILLRLNRELPQRESILKRLVMVFEQMRDIEQAEAFRLVLGRIKLA